MQEHTQFTIDVDTEIFKTLQAKIAWFHTIQAREAKPFRFIPKDKYEIIEKCHNHDIGHWGINRTMKMVEELIENDGSIAQKAQNWSSSQMRKDVYSFVANCDCCIKMSEKQLLSHTNKYVTNEYGVMKCIAVDAIHMPLS